jgi:hypothetical protein
LTNEGTEYDFQDETVNTESDIGTQNNQLEKPSETEDEPVINLEASSDINLEKEVEADEKKDNSFSKSVKGRSAYFYEGDVIHLSAEAKYIDDEPKYATKNIEIEIYKVKEYENGEVFKMAIEQITGLTVERLNIYFYVTNKKYTDCGHMLLMKTT